MLEGSAQVAFLAALGDVTIAGQEHVDEERGEHREDDSDHETVIEQPVLGVSVVADQQDDAQRRRRHRRQPRHAHRHRDSDEQRRQQRYLARLDRTAQEIALQHVVDRVGVDLDARHVGVDRRHAAIAQPMRSRTDQHYLARQFVRRNLVIDDVRDGVVRERLGAAAEINQHPPVVIHRYPHSRHRDAGHAFLIDAQFHRRTVGKRVGERDKQRRTILAVEVDDRHLSADFTVRVRIDVEESDRAGGAVKQLRRRLVRMRIDQIVRLARRLPDDSVRERPGYSNLVEVARGFTGSKPALEMVGLKCVPEHGLALRFHRGRKCLVVARTQHVANRSRPSAPVSTAFD